jgi:stress response protein YsnF
MATTIIGVFDNAIVPKVTDELRNIGLKDREVEVLGGKGDELVRTIVGHGFAEDDARTYAEAVKRGKRLLAAYAPEARLERAVAVMERYENERGEEGSSGRESRRETAEAVPVAEEELEVGKRKVLRGGVRVTSRVEEQPVEETVSLREERVEAERRPVDRRLSEEEAEEVFQDKVVEMTETAEELEVEKEARVVEEIALKKRAETHEETVRDTVRRTDVEVEKIAPQTKKRR